MTTKQLAEFLVTAKKSTYAAGTEANRTQKEDHSIEIVYQEEELTYKDRYYGGEPFGGEEVVFYKGHPFWVMNYYGRVEEHSTNLLAPIYGFLRKALMKITIQNPFRGPLEYTDTIYTYISILEGDIKSFSGRETILFNAKEVYRGYFHGGLVNRQIG